MLEIACFDLVSAEFALDSVADRIEFCSERELGGLTPNLTEFKYLKEKYEKPIYIMIRPRGGDFFYSDEDFEIMIENISGFKKYGADGFVFGILGKQNEIDLERNRFLVELAAPLPCTFHRAVDRTPDFEKSIEEIINIGFQGVLTSGGATNAEYGIENLAKIIKKHENEIDILIGGDVRSENIQKIKEQTGGTIFHSSAILKYGIFANENEISELKTWS